MTKDFILAEIKRTTNENGGKPLGRLKFSNVTGVSYYDWTKHWSKWSDALVDAGFESNEFGTAYTTEYLMSKLAQLVEKIQHFPTNGELKVKANADKDFPNEKTFYRVGKKAELIATFRKYCVENNLQSLLPYCAEIEKEPTSDVSTEDELPDSTDDLGSVYLYKAQGYFKVGRTNNLLRRDREISLQLPEKATLIHRINTDDPVGMEKYWHQRFASKRLNGEWFKLDAIDIRAFKKRKFM